MTKNAKNKLFERIANEHLFIETLEERKMDDLDFHNVSVWGIKAALEAAFEAGCKDTTSETK